MKNWNDCCWLMSWKTTACVCDASNELECECVRENFSPVFLKKTTQKVQAENNSQWHRLPKQSYCSIIHTQVNTSAHTHTHCADQRCWSAQGSVTVTHTHTLQTADWVSWEYLPNKAQHLLHLFWDYKNIQWFFTTDEACHFCTASSSKQNCKNSYILLACSGWLLGLRVYFGLSIPISLHRLSEMLDCSNY